MVVGSMVGSGIFSLPRTFGKATGPFGAIIAWLIAARSCCHDLSASVERRARL
jgi:amino acid transporter